jgi:hypothetical protein
MSKTTKKTTKGGVRGVPTDVAQKRVMGSIVLERVAGEKVPGSLAAALKTFTAAHNALKTATTALDAAHGQRTLAEDQVIAADKQLTAAINVLANVAPPAGIGTRLRPFAGFSKQPPNKLVKLAYAKKVAAARAIVKKLQPKKLPASVAAAVKALGVAANAVATALGAISKPGAALKKAHESLGPIVSAWTTSYARFKTLAAAAWIDEPETFKAVFAKPEKVQTPKSKKTKGQAAKKAAQTAQKKATSAAKKAAAAAKRAAAKAAKVAAATPAPTPAPASPAVPANGVSAPAKPAPVDTSA